jgi:PAS domain S-box-containing protein
MIKKTGLRKKPTLIWPVAAFLLLCAGIAAIECMVYFVRVTDVKERIYNELSAIADLKLKEILEWRGNQMRFAEYLSNDPLVRPAIEQWTRCPGDSAVRNKVLGWMKSVGRRNGFFDVTLVNQQGFPLLSLINDPAIRDSGLCAGLITAFASNEPVLSDLHKNGIDSIHFDLMAPLAPVNGQRLALVFEIDPDAFLFPLIKSWPLRSRSGETLLLRKAGDSIEYLNELRHRKNTALAFRLPANRPGLIASEALRRGNGIADGFDYRGVPVLGAFRAVPGSPWFMVAKVDKVEIMAPVRRFFMVLLGFGLALIAIAALFAAMWQRHQTAEHYKALFQSEQELRQSKARFEALFASMTEGVALHEMVNDPSGKAIDYRIVGINPAYEKHTGLSPEKARGRLATELYGVTTPPYLAEYSRVAETGAPFSFETWFPPMKKHFAISVFSPGKGTFATVFEDITDRKLHESAIIAEKERFLVTLRSIGDGVITTDTAGNITLMNKVAEELTGYSLAESVGRPLGDVFIIVNELTREPCENPVEKVLKSGAIVGLANHTSLICKDGRERAIADSGAPIHDRESKTIGVVLVFRDVTEKQKTDEALNKADKLESIGLLAGGIAHDFNNLLSGIYGYIDLAKEDMAPESRAAEYLEKAIRTFSRAKDLTMQLLTFSKGGAPVKKTMQLGPLLKENVRFALSGSKVAPEFAVDGGLWPCDVDVNQIGQVVDNLVINAIQAMPLGGTISVSADNVALAWGEVPLLKEGNYLRISVVDRGTGIPPSIMSRIWDPFFTTKQTGHGLGLATVYSIIKKHDGVITVESTIDKGTTFTFYLPAAAGCVVMDGPGSSAGVTRLKTGKVLIMDDEESIRETVGVMLKLLGYTPEFALHGREALTKIREAFDKIEPYTAVIMDLTIPGGMGGRETIAELRRNAAHEKLTVFVSSGYSDDPVMTDPAAFGFTDKIAKPFRKGELRTLFERYFPG